MRPQTFLTLSTIIAVIKISSAVVQTANQSFGFNGKSSLDLEYGISLLLLAYFNTCTGGCCRQQ
jgi:hypothetical protein